MQETTNEKDHARVDRQPDADVAVPQRPYGGK